ncbi:MAG: 2-oxoacid:acceptor oxidoreductase family protein [Candidatus Aenigmatarchaeota archaeon]
MFKYIINGGILEGVYEIRIHGRGGQGVRMTAHILGRAAFLSGFITQDFAIYGAERRGAPVASFCRISKEDILTRGYIFNPDAVIVLDPTVEPGQILKGLKEGGKVIVNSERPLEKFPNAVFVDATKIAMDTLGKPIPNVTILGGLLKITNLFPLEKLKEAVRIELTEEEHPEAVEGNIKACEICYNIVK